jgi:3',5'-cyclic AMP phosphodiesterase CpdA
MEAKATMYEEQFLSTAPPVGSTNPVRIWALGDFGDGSKNQLDCRDAIIKETVDHRPDAWLWLGDNAYNIGLDEEYQRHVFRVYQESFFKNTNLYPSPGNHDYGRAKRNPSDISYFKIFTMPSNGEAGGIPSGSESYYAVDFGNVHLISLDSQGELDGGFRIYDTLSKQITWLKKDLAANKLPWTIVYFHHPPYTKGSHDSDRENELVKIRENLLTILERFKVDLVLTGHSHVYERTHPLRGHYGEANTFDPIKHVVEKKDSPNNYRVGKEGQGVIYIVSGSGGQVGGQAEGYPLRAATYYNATVGGSLLMDFNDNRLDAKWICADGQVRDRFSITKEK